eukprot:gene21479-25928_t
MATNPTFDRTETIARLNDRARLGLDPTARITFTRNCLAAFCDPDAIEVVVIQSQLLAAFRTCTFAEDSPERDFGTIEFGAGRCGSRPIIMTASFSTVRKI